MSMTVMSMKKRAESRRNNRVLPWRSLLTSVLSLGLLSACGITAPRSSVGFADLESLGMRDTNRVVNLSIGPTLLHFAAGK